MSLGQYRVTGVQPALAWSRLPNRKDACTTVKLPTAPLEGCWLWGRASLVPPHCRSSLTSPFHRAPRETVSSRSRTSLRQQTMRQTQGVRIPAIFLFLFFLPSPFGGGGWEEGLL